MDDAFVAYGDGRADGLAGREDATRAADADYRVGLVDGQLAAFEDALVAAIRRAMGDKLDG
jgi:hypothetical protein